MFVVFNLKSAKDKISKYDHCFWYDSSYKLQPTRNFKGHEVMKRSALHMRYLLLQHIIGLFIFISDTSCLGSVGYLFMHALAPKRLTFFWHEALMKHSFSITASRKSTEGYHVNRWPSSKYLSLIHIWRCRRYAVCRSRWSPYH